MDSPSCIPLATVAALFSTENLRNCSDQIRRAMQRELGVHTQCDKTQSAALSDAASPFVNCLKLLVEREASTTDNEDWTATLQLRNRSQSNKRKALETLSLVSSSANRLLLAELDRLSHLLMLKTARVEDLQRHIVLLQNDRTAGSLEEAEAQPTCRMCGYHPTQAPNISMPLTASAHNNSSQEYLAAAADFAKCSGPSSVCSPPPKFGLGDAIVACYPNEDTPSPGIIKSQNADG